MIVLSRFQRGDPGRSTESVQPDGSTQDDFLDRARRALTTLATRPGFVRGHLGRAADDPTVWILLTEWESVGAFRRALGSYEVKLDATELFTEAIDEPAAFEVVLAADPAGVVAPPTALAEPSGVTATHQIRASRP